ncbi:MAG TPA: hypothetical protein VJ283_10620, partial [Trebonia sp.]|nr:hypothetical protein [Trebonia sp.]
MTDPSPIAPADGLPEPGPAARSTSEIVTRFVAANFTDALPYILVPVLFILSVIFIPGYFSKLSIISLLILASLLGLASLGQTITIIAGGIDLSIPAVIGLSDIIVTQLYYKHWSLPVIFLIIAGLAILIGTISAVSSVLLHVHSLITSF